MGIRSNRDIRLIALDLDGTTLRSDKNISSGTRAALLEAIASGVRVAIASGRAYETLPESVVQIPGIAYAITSNGAEIYRLSDGSCIHKEGLTPAMLLAILAHTSRWYADETLMYEAFIDGKAYASAAYVRDPIRWGVDPGHIGYVTSTRKPVEDMPSFVREHLDSVDSFDMVVGDPVIHDRILESLEPVGERERFYVTYSVKNRIETGSETAGKGNALRWIMGRDSILPSQAAAFGDADNDIPMFEAVRYGIAVANGTARCLQSAAFHTRSNMDDGVAWAIRNILEIRS